MNTNLPSRTKAALIRSEIYAIYLAAKDPRTPLAAKVLAVLVVGYALSPVDLIPDFIPFIGWLDDLIIIPLGLGLVMKMIPQEVMADSRQRAQKLIRPVKRIFWLAGLAVILLWIALTVLAVWVILKIFHKI